VENYRQEMKPDQVLGEVPKGDWYHLSRLSLANQKVDVLNFAGKDDMSGEQNALGKLGVAQVERQVFPLVYVDDEDTLDSRTGMLSRREVRPLPAADPEFDVIAFFCSGRFNWRRRMPAERSVRMSLIVCLPRGPLRDARRPGWYGWRGSPRSRRH